MAGPCRRCAAWSRRSRCCRPRCSPSPGRSRIGMQAPLPMCSVSRSLPGTRRSRASRSRWPTGPSTCRCRTCRPCGPPRPGGRPGSTGWPRASGHAPSGVPPSGRTGRPGSPPAPPRSGGPGEAACCWRLTPATCRVSTPRSRRCSGPGSHVVLTADLGPAARYRSFLAVSRGQVDIVVGTRAAAFAPVHRLGLVALWDDGDDLYAEPRAPYPHCREVLVMRAYLEQAAMLVGGYSRTVEAQLLLESGWANELSEPREAVRAAVPAGARHGGDRRRPRAGSGCAVGPDAGAGVHGRARRTAAGTGADPYAALRLPARPGLRPLSTAGSLRALRRAAQPADGRCRAAVPAVRRGGGVLVVPALRRSRGPRTGGRVAAYGRGVGSWLSADLGDRVRR